MSTCGLHRLVASNDGVCAAVINPPEQPRVACFNTKVQGDGAEKLASWIKRAQAGASLMLASCSRLSFAHSLDNVTTALQSLGARDPPTRIDDAYALVGIKDGAASLAEARTPCCYDPAPLTNGQPSTICATCNQTVPVASAEAICGASASSSASVLGDVYVGSTFAGRHSPRVNHHVTRDTHHVPRDTHHLPLATCHVPLATCHLPHAPLATCHMRHATCHIPPTTCYVPLTWAPRLQARRCLQLWPTCRMACRPSRSPLRAWPVRAGSSSRCAHHYTYHLPPHRLPPTAYRLPLTAYHSPLTAYRLPLTAYHSPLAAYRLPLRCK